MKIYEDLLVKNFEYNTFPAIVHVPSSKFFGLDRQHKKQRIYQSNYGRQLDDLTIVTWNNKSSPCLFERSLSRFGVPCVTLGQGIRHWQNKHKITLLIEFLPSITTKYVLGVDGFDTLCLRHPNEVVNEFRQMTARMVFNATPYFFPPPKQFPQFRQCQEWYLRTFTRTRRFLNAGVWIGETEFCRKFWNSFSSPKFKAEIRRKIPRSIWWTEQGRVHWLAPKFYPDLTIDIKCRMFQCHWRKLLDSLDMFPAGQPLIL